MSQQPLRFALFGNEYQPKKSSSVEKILSYLVDKGAEIYIDRPFYNFLTTTLGLDVAATGVFDGYNFDVDYVISLGGMVHSLRLQARWDARVRLSLVSTWDALVSLPTYCQAK